jgi:Universal stress protein family
MSPVQEWVLAALQVDTDRIRSQVHRNLRGRWTQPLRLRHVPYRTVVLSGNAGPALLGLARSSGAACIVVGCDQELTLGHRSHGPVARFIRQHAHRPVVCVPEPAPDRRPATSTSGPALPCHPSDQPGSHADSVASPAASPNA